MRNHWDLLGSRVTFSMDKRWKMRICLDKWCGDENLRTSFPSLLTLVTLKDAKVVNVCSHSMIGLLGLLLL